MIDIHTLTDAEFAALPLVIKGESKEVRYVGQGLVVIKFLPTVYSYTANRCGVVEGSDVLRLRATKRFVEVLTKAGLKHVYRRFNDRFVLAVLVMPHRVEFDKYSLPPFVPNDLSDEEIKHLPKAPPIEVIVKWYHGGTSKYRYVGMPGATVRSNHPLYEGMEIEAEGPYPQPIIRFDWRNPLKVEGRGERVSTQIFQQVRALGPKAFDDIVNATPQDTFFHSIRRTIIAHQDRCQDEALPEDLADLFIDVKKARSTALRLRAILEDFLADHDIIINDLCLFIAEDGETIYGEISQDCGRFRHFNLGELDKDVWRGGGSSAVVLKKWQLLLDLIEGKEVSRE